MAVYLLHRGEKSLSSYTEGFGSPSLRGGSKGADFMPTNAEC